MGQQAAAGLWCSATGALSAASWAWPPCNGRRSTALVCMLLVGYPHPGRAARLAQHVLAVASRAAHLCCAFWVQVLLLLVSFAGFAVVVRAIMDMFSSAMAESTTDGTSRQLLGRMLALTLVVWSLFPLVWLLGQAGLVSLTMEQVSCLHDRNTCYNT